MSLDLDLASATALQPADHPAPRRAFVDVRASATGGVTATWHLVRPRSGSQPRYALIEN